MSTPGNSAPKPNHDFLTARNKLRQKLQREQRLKERVAELERRAKEDQLKVRTIIYRAGLDVVSLE